MLSRSFIETTKQPVDLACVATVTKVDNAETLSCAIQYSASDLTCYVSINGNGSYFEVRPDGEYVLVSQADRTPPFFVGAFVTGTPPYYPIALANKYINCKIVKSRPMLFYAGFWRGAAPNKYATRQLTPYWYNEDTNQWSGSYVTDLCVFPQLSWGVIATAGGLGRRLQFKENKYAAASGVATHIQCSETTGPDQFGYVTEYHEDAFNYPGSSFYWQQIFNQSAINGWARSVGLYDSVKVKEQMGYEWVTSSYNRGLTVWTWQHPSPTLDTYRLALPNAKGMFYQWPRDISAKVELEDKSTGDYSFLDGLGLQTVSTQFSNEFIVDQSEVESGSGLETNDVVRPQIARATVSIIKNGGTAVYPYESTGVPVFGPWQGIQNDINQAAGSTVPYFGMDYPYMDQEYVGHVFVDRGGIYPETGWPYDLMWAVNGVARTDPSWPWPTTRRFIPDFRVEYRIHHWVFDPSDNLWRAEFPFGWLPATLVAAPSGDIVQDSFDPTLYAPLNKVLGHEYWTFDVHPFNTYFPSVSKFQTRKRWCVQYRVRLDYSQVPEGRKPGEPEYIYDVYGSSSHIYHTYNKYYYPSSIIMAALYTKERAYPRYPYSIARHYMTDAPSTIGCIPSIIKTKPAPVFSAKEGAIVVNGLSISGGKITFSSITSTRLFRLYEGQGEWLPIGFYNKNIIGIVSTYNQYVSNWALEHSVGYKVNDDTQITDGYLDIACETRMYVKDMTTGTPNSVATISFYDVVRVAPDLSYGIVATHSRSYGVAVP
jgi:hypothetical protein